jgi:nucleotide-binding universal stress UspA family protein
MDTPESFSVLVATDGSEEATAAVNAVTVFPWPARTRVHGVVARSAAAMAEVPEFVWADIDRGLAGVAENARKALAGRWPDAEARVVNGPPVEAILARARRVGARVIVLGSRGHGPVVRLLLGSISLGCIRRMKHAALVVRARPRTFARLAVGLDGSAHSRRAVTFVAGLDVPAGGQVTIVRVLEPVVLPSLALMPAAARSAISAQAAALNAAEQTKVRREAETAAAELRRAGWKVDVVIRKGAPLHELLAATKRARAQLLAVGARGVSGVERLLLGSVAEGALHRSPISVLVVR